MMAPYRYRAISPDGSVISGTMDATNQAMVVQRLRELGQFPVSASLATIGRFSGLLSGLGAKPRLGSRPLSMVTQELATLLKAGLELERALAILERLAELGSLQRSMAAVRSRVQQGASFADALSEEGFPTLFVSTVRAGEFAGKLETTLERLSEYLARSVAIRESIASALVYPAILLATAGLSIVFILVFVLPEFRSLFAEAGRALPWPTRALMGTGDFLREFWWSLLLVLAAVVVGVRRLLSRPHIRLKVDGAVLRLPVLGKLIAGVELERFSRSLGTLLSNGVPLPMALPYAGEVIGNRVLANAIGASASGLREGDGFADRLQRSGVFPAMMIDLISVGEQTGKLDEMLLRQADLDEQRIRHSVNRLLATLVPALTVMLGLMVGGLIASLLSAIISVNDLALPQ